MAKASASSSTSMRVLDITPSYTPDSRYPTASGYHSAGRRIWVGPAGRGGENGTRAGSCAPCVAALRRLVFGPRVGGDRQAVHGRGGRRVRAALAGRTP